MSNKNSYKIVELPSGVSQENPTQEVQSKIPVHVMGGGLMLFFRSIIAASWSNGSDPLAIKREKQIRNSKMRRVRMMTNQSTRSTAYAGGAENREDIKS